jgi:peptide/nickel transport system substrate-binding protein
VQQILVEDVPVAWTLELEYPIIYDKAFKNIVSTGIGSHETFGSVYKS